MVVAFAHKDGTYEAREIGFVQPDEYFLTTYHYDGSFPVLEPGGETTERPIILAPKFTRFVWSERRGLYEEA